MNTIILKLYFNYHIQWRRQDYEIGERVKYKLKSDFYSSRI